MEEIEIIKYKDNFKNIVKKIVKVLLISTAICFVIYFISQGIYSIKESIKDKEVEELNQVYLQKKQVAEEKYEIYSEKSTKKQQIWRSIYNKSPYSKLSENLDNSEEYQNALKELDEAYEIYEKAQDESDEAYDIYWDNKKDWVPYPNDEIFVVIGAISGGLAILTIIFYWYISKMEITVTNTRVYGKVAFGKRVDLPLDSISAVGTSFLKGLDIGTSSGRIHFKGIMNNIEIHAEISKLLNERQTNRVNSNKEPLQSNNISTTEELKKFKELLDTGVITQEEFDAKKKQLLGL